LTIKACTGTREIKKKNIMEKAYTTDRFTGGKKKKDTLIRGTGKKQASKGLEDCGLSV